MLSMANNKIVKIDGLNKKFKRKNVFSDFSLSVPEKAITTIFGSSGSGKSTLLNIVGLLETYNSGNVELFGQETPKINSRKAMLIRRNKIGYLFQNFGLMEINNIKQNLNIGLQYEKLSVKEKRIKMEQALEQVGLNKKLNDHIYNLSVGERQRVAIARILLKPAELILADEPTGSLDPDNRDYIMKKLLQIKDKGKTILVVSHDSKFKEISDNVVQI